MSSYNISPPALPPIDNDCKPAHIGDIMGEAASNVSRSSNGQSLSLPVPPPPDSNPPEEGINKNEEDNGYHFEHAYSEEQEKTLN